MINSVLQGKIWTVYMDIRQKLPLVPNIKIDSSLGFVKI